MKRKDPKSKFARYKYLAICCNLIVICAFALYLFHRLGKLPISSLPGRRDATAVPAPVDGGGQSLRVGNGVVTDKARLELFDMGPDNPEEEAGKIIRYIKVPIRSTSNIGARGIVVAYHSEDLSWLPLYFPDLTPFVYASNDTFAPHHQVHPLGKEAGAFLSFILDYYDNLPDMMVFIHAHRIAYHTWNNDMVNALTRLRWDRIKGYTTLNLLEYYELKQGYSNFDYMREHWTELYGEEFGIVPPSSITAYCCAQFVVRRQDVLLRSRAFYERLYRFVFDPTVMIDAPRVLEHSWHMIFGEGFHQKEVVACDVMICDPDDWDRGEKSKIPFYVTGPALMQDNEQRKPAP